MSLISVIVCLVGISISTAAANNNASDHLLLSPSDQQIWAELELSGVIVSSARRIAVINDKFVKAGDTINGAQVLAIEPGSVHVQISNRAITLHVGYPEVDEIAPEQLAQLIDTTTDPELQADRQDKGSTSHAATKQVMVQYGDTLSGIAERHRPFDIGMEQMMIAIFELNPNAFMGNINQLIAGELLSLPSTRLIQAHSTEEAVARVAQHHSAWQGEFATDTNSSVAPQTRVANNPELVLDTQDLLPGTHALASTNEIYGPVAPGETLLMVAKAVRAEGASLDQTMLAIFDANRDCFGGNINVLYAGVSLNLPNNETIRKLTTDFAFAEVQRQMHEWRSG